MSVFTYCINIDEVVVIRRKQDLGIQGANLIGHDQFGNSAITATIDHAYIDMLTLYARHEKTSEDEKYIYTTFSDLGVIK